MRAEFLGVGEACDERYGNTSILLDCDGKFVLLDCGFTVPGALFAAIGERKLSAIYISHFHGDHFMGLPLVLLRMWEEGRSEELSIIGQPGIADIVEQAMTLAYSSFRTKITYPIRYIEALPGNLVLLPGMELDFAPTAHSQDNLAVRVNCDDSSVFYSGDGGPTRETAALAQGCGLIIHEAYGIEDSKPGHSSVRQCLKFAGETGAGSLALVHVQRDVRREKASDICDILEHEDRLRAFLPEPGDKAEA